MKSITVVEIRQLTGVIKSTTKYKNAADLTVSP